MIEGYAIIGQPPVTVDELEPLLPQKPGDSFTLWSKMRFMWLALTRLFKFLNTRASIVDPRAIEVRVRCNTLSRMPTYEIIKFVKKLREEKKYTKIGAVG